MSLEYFNIKDLKISQDVLNYFDCGHPDFNDFIRNDAIPQQDMGNGVTYVLIDNSEKDSDVTAILAFATIRTCALYSGKDGILVSEPCAEIKYFAIHKQFQKQLTGKNGVEKYYSTSFFEELLVKLYELSITVIGYTGIFLRANENGEKLYRRKDFIDAVDYIIPYEEDDELGKCKPMYFPIADNLYSIFDC